MHASSVSSKVGCSACTHTENITASERRIGDNFHSIKSRNPNHKESQYPNHKEFAESRGTSGGYVPLETHTSDT